jgi:hypothetical protein
MRKLLKFVLMSVLILCVGLPLAIVAFVALMATFGIVLGISGAIIGLVFTVLKVALMVLLPLALCYWIARRLLAPERTY